MSHSKDFKNKFFFIIPILFLLSLFLSVLYGEDTLGGAKYDYFYHEKYFTLFSENFYKTFSEYGNNFEVRNSPIFYIFFSFFVKLGIEIENLKYVHLLVIIPLSIFFIKCLNLKYSNIEKKTQAYLISILFLSPTVRSLCAWPYPFLWAICFFLISIFYFLKFQKSNSSKQKIKYSIFNIIFLALSSYITPNFSVFTIYFFYFFFQNFKFSKELFFLILINLILALPAIYFSILKDFYFLKNEVYLINNYIKYNPANKIIIITSIIFFFFIPYISIENLKKKIYKLKILNRTIIFLILFILLNIFFFNFSKGAGGGIFFHISQYLINNSSILFIVFICSLFIFKFHEMFNLNNFLLFVILILYNPQFTTYYKYFDPLLFFLLLFLFQFHKIINLNLISKKFIMLYLFFLFINFGKNLIAY